MQANVGSGPQVDVGVVLARVVTAVRLATSLLAPEETVVESLSDSMASSRCRPSETGNASGSVCVTAMGLAATAKNG